MTTNKDNLIFEKTSFLHGNNSAFIKEMYLKYLRNSKSIPQSWTEFFDGLNEDQEIIKKEILGPSWAPKQKFLTNKIKKLGKLRAVHLDQAFNHLWQWVMLVTLFQK